MVLAVRYVIAFPFRRAVDLATDRWLGVDTRGTVHNESVLSTLAVGGDPTFYQPIRYRTWLRLMREVPIDPASSTFVDLGCGRGRALFFAARSGFRHTLGVELDGELAREAEINVERWKSAHANSALGSADIRAMQGDAAHFSPPPGNLLLFLYNPFGPDTMRRVLARFCETPFGADDDVFIVYLRPLHADVFAEFPQLAEHARGKDLVVYRHTSPRAA